MYQSEDYMRYEKENREGHMVVCFLILKSHNYFLHHSSSFIFNFMKKRKFFFGDFFYLVIMNHGKVLKTCEILHCVIIYSVGNA